MATMVMPREHILASGIVPRLFRRRIIIFPIFRNFRVLIFLFAFAGGNIKSEVANDSAKGQEAF